MVFSYSIYSNFMVYIIISGYNKTEKVFSDPKRVGLTICHSKLISTLNERISYSKVSIDYPNVNCVFLMLTNPSC